MNKQSGLANEYRTVRYVVPLTNPTPIWHFENEIWIKVFKHLSVKIRTYVTMRCAVKRRGNAFTS